MADTPPVVFTEAEKVVIDSTLHGQSVEDIASALGCEVRVVAQHVKNIGQKFELYSKLLSA